MTDLTVKSRLYRGVSLGPSEMSAIGRYHTIQVTILSYRVTL